MIEYLFHGGGFPGGWGSCFRIRKTEEQWLNMFESMNCNYKGTDDPFNTKIYVCIQENNAIAVINIGTETIEEIYSLGLKSWKDLNLDVSDRDGGEHIQILRSIFILFLFQLFNYC